MALTPCRLLVELMMFATPNHVVLMSTFLIAGKVKNFIYLLCIQLSSSSFFFHTLSAGAFCLILWSGYSFSSCFREVLFYSA